MVYQKKDEFSITNFKPKEIGQYRKVVKFIEECQSGGKHPVLTRSFLSRDFEGLLRRNLLDAVLNLSMSKNQNKEETKPTPAEISQPSTSIGEEHFILKGWLAENNLSANPFKSHTAEDENEKDPARYYVPFRGFPLISNEIVQGNKNWLFFGKEGSGKTALKRFILSRCAPSRQNSKTLAISYETGDFLEALAQSTDVQEILHTAQQILDLAFKTTKIPLRKGVDIRNLSEPAMVFFKLGRLLGEIKGYDRTLYLLDLAPEISDDYIAKLIEVLAHLVSLPTDKIGFRLFLPKNLQNRFVRQGKYLGKCDLREICWDEKDLRELIKQRLIFYSINKANPSQSLAPLCESKGKNEIH